MLLAIDTSAGTSVAVVDRDAGVLAERVVATPAGHAEVIGTLIAAVPAQAVEPGLAVGVVVGMGPGPFTGLRVGIAAARAFAFGAGVPVVPIVSHDAIAFGARPRGDRRHGRPPPRGRWSARTAARRRRPPAARRRAGRCCRAPTCPTLAPYAQIERSRSPPAALGLLAERLLDAGRRGRCGRRRRAALPALARRHDPGRPEAGDLMSRSDLAARRPRVDDLDAIMAIERAVFGTDAWSRDIDARRARPARRLLPRRVPDRATRIASRGTRGCFAPDRAPSRPTSRPSPSPSPPGAAASAACSCRS